MAFGLCRWYFALQPLLDARLQKPLRSRDRDIELILLIGLYQLLVLETGAHAAVDESVKLAKAQKKKWAAGLVNAVLRGAVRDQLALAEDAWRQACPAWMQSRLQTDWGDLSGEILQALNQRPPMTLRVDTRQIEVESWLEELEASGGSGVQHPQVPGAVVLDSACEVTQLPGFAEGRVSVQDAAAQLAAQLLPVEAGSRVLDACAAPGGKTMHLLQHYPQIDLTALDSSERTLATLAAEFTTSGSVGTGINWRRGATG